MGKTSKNPSKQDPTKKEMKRARERCEVVEVPYDMLEFWNATTKYDLIKVDYSTQSLQTLDVNKMYY
jgi:hypothetical protein